MLLYEQIRVNAGGLDVVTRRQPSLADPTVRVVVILAALDAEGYDRWIEMAGTVAGVALMDEVRALWEAPCRIA